MESFRQEAVVENKESCTFKYYRLKVSRMTYRMASLVAQWLKNPPTNAGDVGSNRGSGRSPGGGNSNPL